MCWYLKNLTNANVVVQGNVSPIARITEIASVNTVSGLCSFGLCISLIINLSVLSLGKSSPAPKVVVVQKPVVPPPPPPRKPQPTLFNGGLTPEKPPQSPSTDMQSTILPSWPLKDNGKTTSNHVDFSLLCSMCLCRKIEEELFWN